MAKEPTFRKTQEKHFATLSQYVPVVAKVHGAAHPEFHEVRRLFDAINEKTKQTSTEQPELTEEFAKLREITNHYTIPGDVCESYEAVYKMLSELDEAYHAK